MDLVVARTHSAALLMTVAVAVSACNLGDIPESFVIAYATTSNTIAVRWANVSTPSEWKVGSFPNRIAPGRGVGIGADRGPLLHIVFTDSSNAVRFVWGLGLDVWDNDAVSEPSAPVSSGPVGVRVGDQRWAVSYRRSGESAYIGLYDHSERRFTADFAPQHSLNSSVIGRPSIAAGPDTIVAAWRRPNGDFFDLVTASGRIEGSALIFDPPRVVALPTAQGLAYGVDGDPVLARSGGTYYLSVVREQQGGGAGTLHGWQVVTLRSTDGGASWAPMSLSAPVDVTNTAYLGLGAASTGTLLLVVLEQFQSRADTSAARWSGSAWQRLSEAELSAMFTGTTPAYKPFAVISNRPDVVVRASPSPNATQ